MSQPFKIVTGEPVDNPERYSPQKYHTRGQARGYNTFAEMCLALPMVGRGPEKKKLGYFVPGGLLEYAVSKDKRTEDDRRGRRQNGNIGDLHFVSYDVDEMDSLQCDVLLEQLHESGLAYFVYHTPSSTGDKPRVRILVELDSPQPANTEDKANLMIDIATDIWGEPTGEFAWCDVAFDRTAFREAQYMIRPHEKAITVDGTDGEPMNVAELDEFEHGWELPGVYDSEYGSGEFDDADVSDWHEWAKGRGYHLEGKKIVILCPNRDQHTSNTDGMNSTTILLPAGQHGEARFNCMHDGCDGLNRSQRDTLRACGVPEALLPDAHGNQHRPAGSGFTFNSAPAHDPEKAALAILGEVANSERPKRQRADASASTDTGSAKWDGLTGDYRDKRRAEIAQFCKVQLWQVPPDVKARTDKDGYVKGFTPLNTADNLEWLLMLQGWQVARNAMTWEFETFSRDGRALTTSADETDSMVTSESARRDLPKETYSDHIRAVAARSSFHPIERMLHGKKWDGVKRVDRAISCLVTHMPDYTRAIMWAFFAGAMAAIDDGSVEMKFCPVLFSRENDWHKSQFAHRIFGLTDRSFKGGLPVPDPTEKDSLTGVITCWGGEWGELGGLGKRDTETLKAWIPQANDEWRPPYARNSIRKPRQSVYLGTVNRDDFIKDPSLATRFPVIPLAGPVRIDELNRILGWEYDGSRASLVNAEQLVQFWLEVRAAELSYILPKETLEQVQVNGEQFTDKGGFYSLVTDVLSQNPDENINHTWQTATQFCNALRLNVQHNRHLGRALTKLHEEDEIDRKRVGGSYYYWLPTNIGE